MQNQTNATALQNSKFIVTQVGKYERSKIRLYCALILDVIHSHKAVTPARYAETLSHAFPSLEGVLPKYCTIIGHALDSKHADHIATFGATEAGLDLFTEWLTNQARLALYSLSLEDLVRFFKNVWSVKAQAAQQKADADARASADTHATALATQARESAAIQATEAKNDTRAQTRARAEHQADALASVPALATAPFPPSNSIEGALTTLGLHTLTATLTITETATGHAVHGLDTLTDDALDTLLTMVAEECRKRVESTSTIPA